MMIIIIVIIIISQASKRRLSALGWVKNVIDIDNIYQWKIFRIDCVAYTFDFCN
jgi:hypothetical protein